MLVCRAYGRCPAVTRVLFVVNSTSTCFVLRVVIAAAASAGRCISKFRSSPAFPPVCVLFVLVNNNNNNNKKVRPNGM